MLAFAAEYPKADWDLQVQIGWLTLLVIVLMLVWVWTRSESFRRSIFAREDPRLFALMRIVLGLFTIQCFWNLEPYWRMLWSDEGIFSLELARQRLGRAELAGWTETDGFLDGWAVARFLWGKHSLFYFYGSPDWVIGYMVVFFAVLGLYTVGFRTRITGIVALMMMNGIYNRNGLYMEGTDTVYRAFWFLMLFVRADAAWSVDNWLRVRRERGLKQRLEGAKTVPFDWAHFADRASSWVWAALWAGWFALLTDLTLRWIVLVMLLGITGSLIAGLIERAHRQARLDGGTLELREPARFQLIPAWPRYLMMAQLACIYAATGLYKTGDVWEAGDALYYALNMDHFYRFEGITQTVSAWFATSVFRWMTWVTLWWEKLFPIVLIGMVLKFGLENRDQAWYRAQSSVKWRLWLGRAALLGAYVTIYRTAAIAYPWCMELGKNGETPDPTPGLHTIDLWFLAYIPALVVAWFVLGRWPVKLPLPAKLARKTSDPSAPGGPTKPALIIDQSFMRKWVFGRRIWLTLGFIFHGILIVGMNIGMFPFIMLWTYFSYFRARPWLKMFRWLIKPLHKIPATTKLAQRWDVALSEQPASEAGGVLETPRQALERDPSGPTLLDPWKLLVGPITLLRRRDRQALVEIDDAARERGGRIPDALVLALMAVAVSLVVLRGLEAESPEQRRTGSTTMLSEGETPPDRAALQAEAEAREKRIDDLTKAAKLWGVSILAFALVAHFRRRSPLDRVPEGFAGEAKSADQSSTDTKPTSSATELPQPATPVLMAGTLARTLALALMVWHTSAVAGLFVPTYPITNVWRGEIRKIHGEWISGTNTSQSWKMFAPNPPRGNSFMRTVVVDQAGDHYIVDNDAYTDRPRIFWINDRMRKMHRRMVGKSKWYLRYWSEYHCREWALEHDGIPPEEVQIVLLKTPIPKPDKLEKPSDPRKRKLTTKVVQTHECGSGGELTPIMKQRRGIPLTAADEAKLEVDARRREREAETKRRTWAARKDWGGDPDAYKAEMQRRKDAFPTTVHQQQPDEDAPDPDDEGAAREVPE